MRGAKGTKDGGLVAENCNIGLGVTTTSVALYGVHRTCNDLGLNASDAAQRVQSHGYRLRRAHSEQQCCNCSCVAPGYAKPCIYCSRADRPPALDINLQR